MPIKTLSIPIEMQHFLDDNPDLSPSKMLQSKIIEIQERRRLSFNEIKRLNFKIASLARKLEDVCTENEKLKDVLEQKNKH